MTVYNNTVEKILDAGLMYDRKKTEPKFVIYALKLAFHLPVSCCSCHRMAYLNADTAIRLGKTLVTYIGCTIKQIFPKSKSAPHAKSA